MPRPNLPPTPGSSSDIRGKEGHHAAPAFNLPPTAFHESDRTSTSSSTFSANGSDSSYRSASPSSPADLSRKRSAAPEGPVITKDDFALPPPPTRSRKIIQMKPQQSGQQESLAASAIASPQMAGKTQSNGQSGGKRKSAIHGNTAAGRKIARKTAHSLIERRRRSKMNEEFGVLKDMIPACKGQEMHKLAILQASVDYLRYLEQCVQDLQAQNKSPRTRAPPTVKESTSVGEDENEDEDMNEDDDDDNDADGGTSTPATAGLEHSSSHVSLPSLSQITTTTTHSPSIFGAGASRHYSISSASQPSYSPYIHSNQASPAFGPQLHHVSTAPAFGSAFGLGSPALRPMDSASHIRHIAESATEITENQRLSSKRGTSEQELDKEATAALLMLNHDRRNWRPARQDNEGQRTNSGMSVRDLLSG